MVVAHVKNPLSTFRQSVPVWQRECVCVCVCVCMCVWTEWTWSMHNVGISTYQFILYYASAVYTAHALTHPQTIWGQQTSWQG